MFGDVSYSKGFSLFHDISSKRSEDTAKIVKIRDLIYQPNPRAALDVPNYSLPWLLAWFLTYPNLTFRYSFELRCKSVLNY